MTIIDAIRDENLFRHFLDRDGDLSSWSGWSHALRALYGLPIKSRSGRTLLNECSGRQTRTLPKEGFDTALFLTGRRSGKSRTSAIIGAYEAALAGHEEKLAAGEKGIVAICSPTRSQSNTVRNYLKSVFDTTPLLTNEIIRETREGFDLRNNISIQILAGDYRTVRGPTLVAAIVDEAAFFGHDVESKVKSDTELMRALQPGLATTGGKLIAISTPYARKGWCFNTFKRHYGNEAGRTLVWNCPSRTMNPTLNQSIIDRAMEDDPASARSEYLGQFRDDIAEYLPRSVIESAVIPGRRELIPRREQDYRCFVDVSGGRGDDAALAIAHRTDRNCVIDLIRRYQPPFNPYDVCREMAEVIKRFRCHEVTGDNYAAEFVAQAFEACGLIYRKSEKIKSALYLELLPRLCSGEVELLDDPTLINQLSSLERRTRSGGRDIIDHPPGKKDDLANAVAGVVNLAHKPIFIATMF